MKELQISSQGVLNIDATELCVIVISGDKAKVTEIPPHDNKTHKGIGDSVLMGMRGDFER